MLASRWKAPEEAAGSPWAPWSTLASSSESLEPSLLEHVESSESDDPVVGDLKRSPVPPGFGQESSR